MYEWLKKWWFKCDPEWSHNFTIGVLKRFGRTPLKLLWRQRVIRKPVKVMGISFPNPVGLAAGLDKNGECTDAFGAMGFGFLEVGTVTPKPQLGNPTPRLFRLEQDQAIINRMGFNNLGVDHLVEALKRSKYAGVLGINIGKNKTTPEEQAIDDYLLCMEKVYPFASYITVNISSPNTPGLRNLQHGDALTGLLAAIKQQQRHLTDKHDNYVPVAIKIAPDLSDEEIATMANAIADARLDAIIATNTTLDREAVKGHPHAEEAGGLSGVPVRDKSTHVIQVLAKTLKGKLPIIGVGGIDSAAAAKEKLAAGASLVQIYTGFIYKGPALVKEIVNGL
ncbi:dihydroorotate dehydrogenase (quinone) [Idiomarina tyrosinivorans]|uniref:Dihydroorotate dehydrogenase (quinone) n=1 Tax=Idiomarina tyrosinivorans TaxID=1445662 RepID=A0A432ZU39_9GAMM|nr:quinone-dependent dihydroorotate dehydrogenase [Idiomarina tyrosinivorans]RUO81296.1 dihydroorotate dehydrogenase (quinone) [Idiomarina tyrosinivorans]